ncbi:MAG: RNA-binding S4 domain-containing protein [Bacteroidales bacterium]|nr:RNA-binding S4 domain-containing protein [Candidatus Cryptobacteroides caccocaballi]
MDSTRIDKYLWAIRVYKSRTDATDACKGGKVKLNGLDVKPSREIKAGDMLTARKGQVQFTFRVIEPIDKRQGAKFVPQYAENLTPPEELEKMRAPVETFFFKRDRGTGRPTKKDRRQMDSLWDLLDDGFDLDDLDM